MTTIVVRREKRQPPPRPSSVMEHSGGCGQRSDQNWPSCNHSRSCYPAGNVLQSGKKYPGKWTRNPPRLCIQGKADVCNPDLQGPHREQSFWRFQQTMQVHHATLARKATGDPLLKEIKDKFKESIEGSTTSQMQLLQNTVVPSSTGVSEVFEPPIRLPSHIRSSPDSSSVLCVSQILQATVNSQSADSVERCFITQ